MASSLPRLATSQIPFHPSPSKRKRGSSTSDPLAVHPFVPQLTVVTSSAQHQPQAQVPPQNSHDKHNITREGLRTEDCSSPRTTVARQLQSLDITPIPTPPSFGEAWTRHKRLRTDDMEVEVAESDSEDKSRPRKGAEGPILITSDVEPKRLSPETQDVPQAPRSRVAFSSENAKEDSSSLAPPHTNGLHGMQLSRSPSPCMLDVDSSSAPPSLSGSPTTTPQTPSKRAGRAPLPFHISSPDRTCSPRPSMSVNEGSADQDSSPVPIPLRKNLTWTEAEITGHLLLDPEDDGTGINGIGFKPTPAVAWARSQRRKKQMAEWKAREAREARARRSEKRRGPLAAFVGVSGGGGVTGLAGSSGIGKRGVRFA